MPSLQRDPYNYVVNNATINQVRDLIESAPILAGSHLVDIDEKAERRFRNAIEQFDALGATTIDWTLANNTDLTCTKAELISLFASAGLAATARGAALHAEAKDFKATPTTYRELATWAAGYGVTL